MKQIINLTCKIKYFCLNVLLSECLFKPIKDWEDNSVCTFNQGLISKIFKQVTLLSCKESKF